MIKLVDLLLEDNNSFEDLDFKISSTPVPTPLGVISHEIIKIETFDIADGYRTNIDLKPYHLIFGENSLAIFNAFQMNTIAGLKKSDCEKFIANRKIQGKDELDDAFIAGLTNFAGNQLFQFFNVSRLKGLGMASRTLPHESLHLSRCLITLFENPSMNINEPDWWTKPQNAFIDLKDENEEFFAEVLERTTTIASDRWNKII
jgi:hypothetical protein